MHLSSSYLLSCGCLYLLSAIQIEKLRRLTAAGELQHKACSQVNESVKVVSLTVVAMAVLV